VEIFIQFFDGNVLEQKAPTIGFLEKQILMKTLTLALGDKYFEEFWGSKHVL